MCVSTLHSRCKSVLEETWRAASLRILTQKMSSPFCSLWNWGRAAFPQKPRFLPYPKPKSLNCLDPTASIQIQGKLEQMKPKIIFIVLPFLSYLPKDKFCLVSLRGSTALSMQGKEGAKSTLIKSKQWAMNCAAVRNPNRLNKHWTTDHFINTLPYCFSKLFFPFWFILCDRSLVDHHSSPARF